MPLVSIHSETIDLGNELTIALEKISALQSDLENEQKKTFE